MNEIYVLPASLALLTLLFYLLWINGYLILRSTRAVLFAGSYRKNCCKLRFASCCGTVKKVIRFRESRSYTFQPDHRIAKGTVGIQILDKNKAVMLEPSSSAPAGTLRVEREERYFLVLKFSHADGAYELTWS